MQPSIRHKIILFVATPIFAVYALILGYALWQLHKNAERQVEKQMAELASHYAAQFDSLLRQVAQVALGTAASIETHPGITEEQIYGQLERNVTANPLVYGAAVAFEPGEYRGRKLFSPYVYRGPNALVAMDIAAGAYDYTQPQWEWWNGPRRSGTPLWTAPYFDEGAGNILMSTFSVPFHRDGRFWGVTTVDIPLAALKDKVDIQGIRERNFAIVSGDGRFVFHHVPALIGKSVAAYAAEKGHDGLVSLARRMTAGGKGAMRLPGWDSDESQWVYYAPIVSTGWSFAARVSESEALAFAREQERRAVIALSLSFGVILLVVWLVAGRIARPIMRLDAAAREVAEGRLDVAVPVESRDEVGRLGLTFRDMTAKLAARDKALREQAAGLERRVEERTAELRKSEARIRALVNNVPGAIYRCALDTDRTMEYLSDQIEKICGYPASDFIGNRIRSFASLIHSDEVESVHDAVLDAVSQQRPYALEYRILHADGTPRWIYEMGQPSINSDGRADWLDGALFDNTERKHEEEKFRALFEHSSEAHLIVDEGGIIDCNQAAADLFGYADRQALVGRLPALLSPEYQPDGARSENKAAEMFAIARRVGHNRFDWVHRRANGGEVPVEVTLTPIVYADRRVMLGVLHDLSARKRVEEEMLRARRLAEESSRAKGDFLANMSHEIRTPLNGIIGFTTLALRTELSAQQQDYLQKIQLSSNALLSLINDILDFSKIEAGKLHIEHTDFQLQDVLGEVGDLFADRAARKDIEMAIARDSAAPSALVGDPLRLRQVLVNLTGNALKFTDKGEILLRVRAVTADEEQARLRFEVRDTGVGIAPEHMGRLFESFTQADGSTTRKYGGTGLGLTISRQLVALMGGEIGVESEPGRGSTFWFEIPFRRQQAGAEPSYRLGLDLRGLKALVVDDNDLGRQVLVDMMHAFGFEVDGVASGEEALGALLGAVAKDRPYGLVLMDWRMPALDGLAASRQIRETPALADLPIVMVTAFGREEETRAGKEIGIDAFLTKPVQQSLLFNALMEVFGQAEAADGAKPVLTEESVGAGGLAGARVLLAEDNLINQEVAVNMLAAEGINVDIANNGREALERVCQRRYDAVLMDMQMPEMDGYEATRKMRQDRRLEQLPIIAMTAHAMQGDREKCLSAGANDYVSKPVDPLRLFEALGNWVTAESGRESGPPPEAPTPMRAAGEPLDVLTGFDVEDALGRLRGNRALYRKLLGDLARDHAQDHREIVQALDAGDLGRARSLAHTLRGLAGNLSASALHGAAAGLESAIAESGQGEKVAVGRVDAHLTELGEVLVATVQAIRSVVPEVSHVTRDASSGGDAEPAFDQALLQGLARRIREAAEVGDIMGVREALAQFPQGSIHRVRLARLADDFDLEALRRAAEALENSVIRPSEPGSLSDSG